jgi:squalene-associated FAD-dependent desaturase
VPKPKKIAVVGAGWAGTASALFMHNQGHRVTVFESARLLGGRARGVLDDTFGMIDNGQHLMLGAYQETLKLIAQLNPGIPEKQLLTREPLYLISASGDMHLKATQFLPAPLNTLIGLMTATGISWPDKFSMVRLMAGLIMSKPTHPHATQDITVLNWLREKKQSALVIQKIWQPLCLAMLNTPVEAACAQLFQNVLRDSLGSSMAGATDLVLPRTDLSTLAPQRLVGLLDCRLGHTVREIACLGHGIEIDGEPFDGCIIAAPPYNTLRLVKDSLKQTTTHATLVHQLSQFTYAPITTCYMRLSQPFDLPAPMLMLNELPNMGHIGQWVFQRQSQADDGMRNPSCDLAVIISDSSGLLKESDALVQALHQQIATQLMQRQDYAIHPLPGLQAFRVITEKRATFVAQPGLKRPSNFTDDARLMLAGDWTDTGYPAVIEGAVRSGLKAARGLFSF